MRNLREATARLDAPGVSGEGKRKAGEEVSKNLFQIKFILYGDGENEPQPDQVAQLAQEVYNNDVLQLLVQNIWRFEFEAKKDVSQIFNNLLRRQIQVQMIDECWQHKGMIHQEIEQIEG